jgi:hypothetical protein
MTSDKKRDYEVGYGKPPRRTRFRKGQSGNPCGRPNGAKNLSTLLREELNERVIVVENGRRRKITKRKVIIMQVVNRAAKGYWRDTKLILDIEQDLERRTDAVAPEAAAFGEADKKVIEQLNARRFRNKGGSDD